MVLSILVLALLLPFASAGFLDKFFGKDVQKSPQDFSVTVGNADPVVSITSIDTDNLVDLIQGSITPVQIIFNVTDANGLVDLNETTLFIQYTYDLGGEATRSGNIASCSSGDSGNTRTYICNINMEHYDAYGAWTATVSIDDQQAGSPDLNTRGFTVIQLRAISLSPATINFPSTTPGVNDYLSSSNTTVTNEGNYNLASNDLGITAYNLCDVGCTNTLATSNFNSGDQSRDPCTLGETLINSASVPIPIFTLTKGNPGTPLPTRDIRHCLDVPAGTAQAVYSTANPPSQQWNFLI